MTTLDDMFTPHKEEKLKTALLLSCALHILLFFIVGTAFFTSRQEIIQPKPILVHSVKLNPRTASKPPKYTPPPPSRSEEPKVEKESVIAMDKEIPQVVEEKQPEVQVEKESPKPAKKVTVEKEKLSSPAKTQVKKVVSSKKVPPPPTSKKAETSQVSKKNKEIADSVQSLLAKARKQRSSQKTGSSTATSSSKTVCNQIASLSFENSQGEDDGDYPEMTPEEAYISSLVRLIQLSITIPDREPVSLRLTLLKSGVLKSLSILSSPSARNRKNVEKGLSLLRFASFNNAYLGEKEHTFTLKLNREMEWSSFGHQ